MQTRKLRFENHRDINTEPAPRIEKVTAIIYLHGINNLPEPVILKSIFRLDIRLNKQ